ncbi:M23 family peptidase [Microbacterium hominis]|uniref:M23 family peptidase n=2 Tax=Microbacteriaceae TaxID=85023 RepID=A0A2K9DMF9_9MICO|nr:M23 family peptidase [Microbacterium hominis]
MVGDRMTDQQSTHPGPEDRGAGEQIKEAGAQIAGGAIQGAIQGAVVGGGAGAAAGAVKGAAVSAAQTPVARKLIVGLVVAVMLFGVAVGLGGIGAASALASAIAGTSDQNTEYAIKDDNISGDVVNSAEKTASRFNVPKELVISVLLANEGYDFGALVDRLDVADPQRAFRDLRTGSLSTSTEMARYIPDKGTGADEAKKVRKLYVDALAAGGFSQPQADSIYAVALQWALGNTLDPDEAACLAPATVADGEQVQINASSWTAGQVANMKIAIGLAKTMFPDDARAAATIALITIRQESGFKNYANDGLMTPDRDPNPGPFTASDYAELKYSLELPHDAVGTDHASLGLLQQQATMGWGDYKTSTWASGDYKGVIGRLMNPSYTIGKFLTKLAAIDGWQSMEPGAVAQRIQVSAFPDAYAKHLSLATEIWRVYGPTSPALAVPESTGWSGATFNDGPQSAGACKGSPFILNGKYAWPVEMRDDGTPAGFITSHFGTRILNGVPNYHSGLDLSGNGYGSDIYALADGVVVKSNLWSAACGEYIQIAHADGTATGYLHMTDRLVSVGEKVTAGQLIAHMGGGQPGGCTFGAHLHLYAFDQQGTRIDPLTYLTQRGLVFPAERDIAAN